MIFVNLGLANKLFWMKTQTSLLKMHQKIFFAGFLFIFLYQVRFYCAGSHGWFMDDDVIKWKHFPHYWPFVWGIHRSPVNSPHKGQWRGTLMLSLICARINCSVNNRKDSDLRCHRAHYGVIVMEENVLDKASCLPFMGINGIIRTILMVGIGRCLIQWR